MANRSMQQKMLKLQRQRHARPYELPATCAVTRDSVQARDCETGEVVKPKRYEVKSVQRKLVLHYAPAGEWTLYKGARPERW